jgi:hypothetical protein
MMIDLHKRSAKGCVASRAKLIAIFDQARKHLIAPWQERQSVDAPTEHGTEDVECLASNVGESEVIDVEQELIDCLIIGTIKAEPLEGDDETSTVRNSFSHSFHGSADMVLVKQEPDENSGADKSAPIFETIEEDDEHDDIIKSLRDHQLSGPSHSDPWLAAHFGRFRVGNCVCIRGLREKPELNGKTATVTELLKNNTVEVRIWEETQRIKLSVRNVQKMSPKKDFGVCSESMEQGDSEQVSLPDSNRAVYDPVPVRVILNGFPVEGKFLLTATGVIITDVELQMTDSKQITMKPVCSSDEEDCEESQTNDSDSDDSDLGGESDIGSDSYTEEFTHQ